MSDSDEQDGDASGWQPWSGGACPIPGDCLVEVRRRYAPDLIERADQLVWSHDLYVAYGASDILAYRFISGKRRG
jgi:hypothetical protein